MPRSNAPAGTARTQRNRKVSCEADTGCGFAVYVSRLQLQRAGVWACPVCGSGRMLPVDPEDAALVLEPVELDSHPAVVEYRQALSSVLHGQAPHGVRGRALRSADELAAERVERERRVRARERRLAALRPVSDDEPIPF